MCRAMEDNYSRHFTPYNMLETYQLSEESWLCLVAADSSDNAEGFYRTIYAMSKIFTVMKTLYLARK